jgi:hypothetical protein
MPVKSDSAYVLTWDERTNAQFAAMGASASLEANCRDRLRLSTMLDLSRARVLRSGASVVPEWDVPWTSKTEASWALVRNHLTVYLVGLFAEGLPSHELIRGDPSPLWTDSVWRAPAYRSIDAKIELRQPIGWKEHYVAQLEVYALWRNIFDWRNVREYYWDDALRPQPVVLGGRDYHLGLRATVRF